MDMEIVLFITAVILVDWTWERYFRRQTEKEIEHLRQTVRALHRDFIHERTIKEGFEIARNFKVEDKVAEIIRDSMPKLATLDEDEEEGGRL